MNNEEKILSILETMNGRLTNIETDISTLKERVEQIDLRVEKIELQVEQTDMRVEKIELQVEQIDMRVEKIELQVEHIDLRVDRIDAVVMRTEHDHGVKLSALFDGYAQNSQKLDRIEQHVSAQDEIILRKVF